MKYNFYEIRKTPRNEPLPADINEPVESIAKRLGGDRLVGALAKMRGERLYGEVFHLNKLTGAIDGQFVMRDGICIRYNLIEKFDEKDPNKKPPIDQNGDVIIHRSIYNPNVLLSKPRGYKNGPDDTGDPQ
jgi:hypothetical protein